MLGNIIQSEQFHNSLGIGKLMREIRNAQNLTIKQVSTATGIAEETIRRIELDKFEPKVSTLETLSNYYRLDIIELISRNRSFDSMFSDAFISKVNQMVNARDFNQLRSFADLEIKTLTADKNHNQVALTTFLYSLKYIKYDPQNGQNDTISVLESILLKITPDYLKNSGTNFPLPIEVSCILLLSIMYRQNRNFNQAIELLTVTIERILNMPLINVRFSDYLASAYLNLAYTYHSMEAHDKVVETVDKCLNHLKVNYNKIVLSHLLFRKGLALYFLDDPLHHAILSTALSLMSAEEQEQLKKVMKTKYHLELP